MVFTLVSVAQEHLEKVIERIKKEKEEIERIKELEIKKEEEKKYHGTHVTVESFTKWRIEFENEINERTGKKNKEDVDSKKLTGLFLLDHQMLKLKLLLKALLGINPSAATILSKNQLIDEIFKVNSSMYLSFFYLHSWA